MVGLKGGPMLAHDYTTLFRSSTCSRTSRICLDESRGRRRPVPGRRRWRASSTPPRMGRGLGEQDFASVLEVVEGLAGVRL